MQYPESENTGDMILKKKEAKKVVPVDCMRVMLQKIRACPKGAKINFPQDVVNLMHEMKDYERERAMIIHLDTKNNVIGIENTSTGSLNSSIVHPREAIKGAILNSAANTIFVHNHPSGDPQPSREDTEITRKLREAFSIVGITMLDSIIIGKDGYYSFKESGIWPTEIKQVSDRMTEHKHKLKIDDNEEDACGIAVTAAMSVIKDNCGKPDEEELEMLERQARDLIEKVDRNSRPGLEKQLNFYKENEDMQGMLKFIDYLKTWAE